MSELTVSGRVAALPYGVFMPAVRGTMVTVMRMNVVSPSLRSRLRLMVMLRSWSGNAFCL